MYIIDNASREVQHVPMSYSVAYIFRSVPCSEHLVLNVKTDEPQHMCPFL